MKGEKKNIWDFDSNLIQYLSELSFDELLKFALIKAISNANDNSFGAFVSILESLTEINAKQEYILKVKKKIDELRIKYKHMSNEKALKDPHVVNELNLFKFDLIVKEIKKKTPESAILKL